MDKIEFSIVIPAYNEGKRILSVLSKYGEYFDNQEIIVVCNGCRDDTVKKVRRHSLEHPYTKTLQFGSKLGKGGAIIEGFKVARGDKIGFVDSDESVTPQDIERMFKVLSQYDGVIASRKLQKSKILVKQPLTRRFSSRVFNIIIRTIFALRFQDTQCGAKVFRKEAIRNVLPSLKTNGFEFDVELLWKLKNRGYRVYEFPITWTHSPGSTFSLWNAPAMMISLLKVRLWK
jgi:dolichol-phosphate mannosyltransferase